MTPRTSRNGHWQGPSRGRSVSVRLSLQKGKDVRTLALIYSDILSRFPFGPERDLDVEFVTEENQYGFLAAEIELAPASSLQLRLLSARTFHIQEFLGDDIPPYTILSHTWATKRSHSKRSWVSPVPCTQIRLTLKRLSRPAKSKSARNTTGFGSIPAASKSVHPTTEPHQRGCVCRRKIRSLTRSERYQTVNSNERGPESPQTGGGGCLNLERPCFGFPTPTSSKPWFKALGASKALSNSLFTLLSS